jgi:hypothetical protein
VKKVKNSAKKNLILQQFSLLKEVFSCPDVLVFQPIFEAAKKLHGI